VPGDVSAGLAKAIASARAAFTNEGVGDPACRAPPCPPRSHRQYGRRVSRTYTGISNIALISCASPSRGCIADDGSESRRRMSTHTTRAKCAACVWLARQLPAACAVVTAHAVAEHAPRRPRHPRWSGQEAWAVDCPASEPCGAPDRNSGGMLRIEPDATTCRGEAGAASHAPCSRSPARSCRGMSALVHPFDAHSLAAHCLGGRSPGRPVPRNQGRESMGLGMG
jgi:hypothetical protein